MTWENRTRPVIKLTSPEGSEFEALWQGSTRSRDKKLGLFEYPDFVGTIVQDLEFGSWNYTMTIYFGGADHDIIAENFATATTEKGQWEVIHPTKGQLVLQIISMTENNLVVENGNFTSFELSFIEPANIEIIFSEAEASTQTNALAQQSNASLGEQFNGADQDRFSKVQSLKNGIDSVTTSINKILGPLASTVAEINNQFNQIIRSIQTALDAAILQPLSIAAQIQQLTQLPGLVSNDFQARMESYNELANEIIGNSPEGTTREDYNKVLVQETSLGAILVASAQIATNAEFQTRSQVIDAIEQIDSLFSTIVNHLDSLQNNFKDLGIDLQYFSQSQSYTDILLMKAAAFRLLILSIFDLAIEKRFTLKKQRSPLEITVTEYGTLGEDDINYNIFLVSNNLKGNDILILPAGREVVVYV